MEACKNASLCCSVSEVGCTLRLVRMKTTTRFAGAEHNSWKVTLRALGGCAAVLGLLMPTPAAAQQRTFTLDRAQVSAAPDDGFMVHRPYMGEETRFYVNGALGFALNPLRDSSVNSDIDSGHIIHGQFPVYLAAGLQIAGIVGINFHIPFTPLQIPGEEPSEDGRPYSAGLTDRYAAMNDLRFDARVKIWESNNRMTRIGAFGGFTVPTGARYGFGGDGSATALLAASAEHDFGSFFITGHMGPHFRPDNSIARSLYVGSELRYAFGAFMPMRDNRIRLGVEIWGSTGLTAQNGEGTFFDGQHTTFEWLAQARIAVSKDKQSYMNFGGGTRLSNGYGSADMRLMASFGRYFDFRDKEPEAPAKKRIQDRAEFHDVDSDGDGYPDDIDACPDVKEDGKAPNKTDGCPAPADADKDGIPDSVDKCPNEAEDFDGIKDKDGCPETDADKDKVPDEVDKCPLEPGPANKDAEKNGCPTMTKVTADGTVTLLQPVEFARGKATIKPVSFPMLKEVATLMEARPTIKISIQGHTDNIGSVEYNKKLSADRAEAVLKYLVSQGIAADRLNSTGFGPEKPIADNNTEDGRARNRRVDFVIEPGTNEESEEAWE